MAIYCPLPTLQGGRCSHRIEDFSQSEILKFANHVLQAHKNPANSADQQGSPVVDLTEADQPIS